MIFKTMTNTSGKTGIQPNNFISGLFNGDLFKKQTFSLSEVLSTSDVDAIKAYNKQIDNCVTSQTAFNRTMLNTSKEAQNVVAAANGNKVALDGLTKSSKAAELGMKALAMAGNMLLIYALTSAVDILYKCATASDRLAESAAQMGSEFVSTKSDISDYKTKIKELYQTINDDTSSYEDTYNARQELLKIQDEMIDKFGDEADAVKLVTDAINGQTDSLDTLTQDKWQETVNAFNSDRGKGWTEKVADAFANIGHGNNFQRMIDEMEDTEVTFHMIPMYGDDTYEEFSKKLKEDFGADITRTERDDAITLSGDLDTIYKQLLNIQTLAKGMGIDDTFLNDLGNQADEAKSKLDEYQEMYSQHVLYDKIFNSEDYEKSFDEINKAYEKYQDAFASGDEESIEKAKQNYAEIVQSATKGLDDQSVIDYFNSMYPDLQEVVGGWEFEVKFKAAVDDDSDDFEKGVQDAVNKFDTIEDIKNYNPKVATDEQKDAYLQLKQYADEYGLTLDQLIDKLVQLGLLKSQSKSDLLNKLIPSKSSPTAGVASVLTDTMDGVDADEATKWVESLTEEEAKLANSKDFENALEEQKKKLNGASLSADDYAAALQAVKDKQNENSEETPISSTDILAQVQALSTGLDQLDKIYADVYDKEDFDWSSILNNDGFKEAFGNMTNVTEEYKNAYDDFIETISNNPSDLSACQSAFDNLATAYIYNSDALKNVTEETKASTIAMLSQMGVVNAAEVVNYRLGASESYAADTGKDLESATLSEITAFAKEADMSDITKASLAAYVIEKIHAASITITTSADINNLTALCSQLGVAGTALAQFARLKAIAMDTSGKYTDGYKEYATTAADQILQNAVNAAQTKYTPQFGGGSATSKAMDDAAKSAKKASDTAKETAQTLDWIETKLKLASKETEKLSKSFDKAFGMNQTRERYHAYISQIESEIQDNTTAAQVYQEKLNQIGLSYEWIAKIQSGAFSIDSITDENLKTQISEYQTYSDKLNSCYDTIESLEEERLQASVNYAEKLIDSHEKEIDSINKLIDRRKALVSLKETFGLSASKSDLKYQQDQYEQEIDALERQNKEIYDLMWTTTYGDEAWQKYNDQMIENTSSIQDLTQSLADLASEMANLPIDKYEKALDKISAKNDLLDAKLENATSDKAKSKIIGSQLKLTRKKDNSAQSAAKTTQSNLNQSVKDLRTATKMDNNISVYNVDALGPNVKARTAVNDYYKKVQNYTKAKKQIPASLISKISGDGYSTLSKACANYNAALVANDTAQERAALSRETIRQELADLAEQRASLAKTTADSKVEKYDSKDELYDAKLDNATSTSSKNKLIDRKISNINNRQSAYNTAVKTDNKNIKSAQKNISKIKSTKKNKKILASIKKAAKAGKRISQSLLNKAAKLNDGGKLYDACVQYNAYLDAKEADKATADLYKETAKQDKATLAKEKFDNISSDYENKISSNEQKKTALNNKISLAQEQGKQISAAYYKSLISSEKGEKNKLIKERKDLQKSLNDAVIKGSIKKGSDEWHEMVSAINEVTNAIDESTQSIVEYQNALRQLKWDAFDKSMETVKRINSENDYYIDLMSHKDMTDKDTGNFTKYGTATIGLHKTNYDNYLAQADEYQREYNKIMRQIEKGELSLSDENVIQRLRDLQDAHRDAKKSAEDELQSIQDLVKQGYEAQTDALSELIDKYKKLKDSELEAYKYQKEIAEKTKTIASLQKQLTAYNGNDSEESRAQIQKLKVQLEEAKSDLKDTQYEKFISDTEDMLDDLMTDYQKFIDEKLNDTNTILDEIKTLLGSDIIETIKGLDSNLTNDTKDQIGSSTTNGGDGGQAAKDYVHNTVTNDQNKVNSKTDTSSYDPAKEADIAKKKNGIAQKKKAINGQRQSFQNQIKELESQLKQLYGELNSIENKYQFEKSSTKNKDKLQDLKNNYIEKKSGLNAMIQDVTHNKDMLQQFIADLDKQSAQLDKDLASINGYEKGSEHIDKRQLAWTQENKRELIYRAADGALLTELNPGDKVFTNEMTENLWELAKTNPSLLYSSTNFVPKLPDIAKSAGTSTIVEVGDIVMNGVNDPETFGRQLREEICKNGKTTQCITEAVSAKQLKKNSIGNARLYK